MITKKIWVRNILGCVEHIADPEYQERAWIKCEIHWPCSLEELVCSFLSDGYIQDLIDGTGDEFNLTLHQKEALKNLASSIDKYGDNPEIYFARRPPKINEAKVIVDPEWHVIRRLAKDVLDAFGEIQFDLDDKEWWLPFTLNSVEAFANVREQKCMWKKKNRVFFSTPKDMYLQLFKDNLFDMFVDEYAEKFGCSKTQILALNRFRMTLKTTFSPNDPVDLAKILKNPEWKQIQGIAYHVLETFNEQKRVSFFTFWSRELRTSYICLINRFLNWKYQRRIKNGHF